MKISINNQPLEVQEGLTIMEACNAVGIHVPSLCYLKDVSHNASCGVCVVEVKGAKSLLRSCITQVTPGMEITTNTQRVMEARRVNIQLMLANHPQECLGCDRNQNCELQEITFDLGINERSFVRTKKEYAQKDESSLSLVRRSRKMYFMRPMCCRLQRSAGCKSHRLFRAGIEEQNLNIHGFGYGHSGLHQLRAGARWFVRPELSLKKVLVSEVWKALNDPEKVVLVQTAPAIRVGIGEAMGMADGSLVTGQMVAGLRRLGFSKVFDTNFAADLTIIEEGNELISRIKKRWGITHDYFLFSGLDKVYRTFLPEIISSFIPPANHHNKCSVQLLKPIMRRKQVLIHAIL